MIKIELTQEQAQNLYQLLVIGMKAGDENNMRVGLPLVDAIKAAVIASQSKPE
jgi:hypothetical protein